VTIMASRKQASPTAQENTHDQTVLVLQGGGALGA